MLADADTVRPVRGVWVVSEPADGPAALPDGSWRAARHAVRVDVLGLYAESGEKKMNVEEAVETAAKEARAILAGRGVNGFWGEVGVRFQADRIVTVEIRETIRAT
jgi:hypothetical protein